MMRFRDPRFIVLALFFAACVVGIGWGLPGTDSWASDAISPRSCGLGAIALTYTPGRFHIYPPLHMAILTVLSLPWIGIAAANAGSGEEALAHELVKPLYMTGIEIGARAVAIAMALGIVMSTMRLWTRLGGPRVGLGAGMIVVANAVLVYYAHTGNLEVPYLFWVTWALVEIDRVASGEPRETHALLLATAAVLTKDQAAAAFLVTVPAYLVVAPIVTKGTFTARSALAQIGRVARSSAIAAGVYLVVSGALVNPRGFRARLALLFGPASKSWTHYPPGAKGAIAIGRDAIDAIPHFTSWPIAIAACVGLVVALFARTARRDTSRGRVFLPFAAAASFTLFFTLSARRTEDRFLLPQSLLFFPYAAFAFDRAIAWCADSFVRAPAIARLASRAIGVVAACAFVPAVLGVASMDATLLVDPRYQAERFLAALPPRTPIEVYGGSPFMPRIPSDLAAVRPGLEPIADRRAIPGVAEIVDPAMDPRPRAPAYLVLATELSSDALAASGAPGEHVLSQFGVTSYRDDASRRLFHDLRDGAIGYTRVVRATCALPWPLACRAIHDSTATEAWIYAKSPANSASPENAAP